MKIAVISDIHGNNYALNEVLKAAKSDNAEHLLVLGDICGYYYHADKVWRAILQWNYDFIKGNHERILRQLINGEIDHEQNRLKYGSGHKYALDKMTTAEIDQLIAAPDVMEVIIDHVKIKMCHGSPMDPDQYLYPDTEVEILNLCNENEFDFVLVGHSHYPFAYRNKNSTLINVGSVGQSRAIGGLASWAMINTKNKTFEIRQTPYDTKELINEVEMNDPDVSYLKSILTRNRNK